jgi:glucarate dehydratase
MRRAFGDGLRIRVQCSGESNAMSARSLLDDIDDLDIDYVADAVAPITGQQRIRRTCRTPLASTLPPGDGLATWIQAGAGEVILGDPVGWGGITEFRKHAAVCRAFNVDLAVLATNMLGPAVGASLQLIVSHATASKGFHGVAENLTRSSVVTPAPVVRNGRLNVPEGPGIGWSLDAARLSARVHEQMIISSRDGKRP